MEVLQNHNLNCPYCGETIQVVVDCSVPSQDYIEDCQVCCRPINLSVSIEDEDVHILASHENE